MEKIVNTLIIIVGLAFVGPVGEDVFHGMYYHAAFNTGIAVAALGLGFTDNKYFNILGIVSVAFGVLFVYLGLQ